MRKHSFLFMLFIALNTIAQPQYREQVQSLSDKVLFTVDSDTITAGEYIAVYNKNRNIGEDIDPKTPLEYLELYKNFKLKVHQAREMGMDTTQDFLREYTTYRNQLAKPYLTDRDVTEELIEEAYDRLQYDVRAAHIMLEVPEEATNNEAAEIRKKVVRLRERIVQGEDFAKLAEEHSADTYSAKKGGDLGYFTAFNMVYPFEDAAYELQEGEISEPVRTRFGYHIIKKMDQRPARGEVQVAHIVVIANDKMSENEKKNAEQKINEIYDKLEQEESFEVLAQTYSEDKKTASDGGVLPPFGINKMLPEFEDAAFALDKPGDYSKPVRTSVGWHIIKLLKKEEMPSFEEMKADLKVRVDRDSRSQQSRESVIKKLKLEYGFKEYPKVKKLAFDQVDKSYLQAQYSAGRIKNSDKVLFEFAGKQFTLGDFLNYLEDNHKTFSKAGSLRRALEKAYEAYSEESLINYEEARLEKKYPEFRMLAREYYEGILLFDLTEQKVWKKSVIDTSGLRKYYQDHQEEYKHDTRYDASIVSAASKSLAKKAKKMLRKNSTVEEIKTELNKDSQLDVEVESGLFERDDKKVLQTADYEKGFSDITEKDGRWVFVYVKEILPPSEKTFEEARGAVISDYQNYLETEWLKELKSDYQVNVNQDVLNDVVEILEKPY